MHNIDPKYKNIIMAKNDVKTKSKGWQHMRDLEKVIEMLKSRNDVKWQKILENIHSLNPHVYINSLN